MVMSKVLSGSHPWFRTVPIAADTSAAVLDILALHIVLSECKLRVSWQSRSLLRGVHKASCKGSSYLCFQLLSVSAWDGAMPRIAEQELQPLIGAQLLMFPCILFATSSLWYRMLAGRSYDFPERRNWSAPCVLPALLAPTVSTAGAIKQSIPRLSQSILSAFHARR